MTKKKMGRPRTEIDWDAMDKLCRMQATLVEVASFFDCSEDTINNAIKREYGYTFSEYHKRKSAGGRSSLRRKQFESALKGNTSLLIWLGKQYLGQADVARVDNTSSDGTMSPQVHVHLPDNGRS